MNSEGPLAPTDIAKILADTPPTDLALLRIARELVGPDGMIDLDRAAERSPEIEDARRQASDYAAQTTILLKSLQCHVRPSPHQW